MSKESGDMNKAVSHAIKHARDKEARICVIYDKKGLLHRNDVKAGMVDFEKRNTYRLDEILVINDKGKVHKWFHDKRQGTRAVPPSLVVRLAALGRTHLDSNKRPDTAKVVRIDICKRN